MTGKTKPLVTYAVAPKNKIAEVPFMIRYFRVQVLVLFMIL